MKTKPLRRLALFVFATCLTVGAVACTDDAADESADETGEEGSEQGLDIAGDYVDEFMFAHSISDEQWTIDVSDYAIVEYDNEQMYVIAQNASDNEYFPDLWSRFDWTWDAEDLYYCQSVYDGETIDDARNGSADPSDLQTGCGTFPWSKLTPS